MLYYESNDELAHYGVLGMKWGIRRASKKGETYTYKSHGQKKWEKKYTKRLNSQKNPKKTQQAKEKLDLYKARDKNRQYYAERTSVGKAFAKQLLLGPIGSGNYSRYRASGDTKLASYLKSNIVSSTFAMPISILLSRSSEFKTAQNKIRN